MKRIFYGLLGAVAIALLVAWSPIHHSTAAGQGVNPPIGTAPSETLQKPALSSLNAAKQMSQAFVEVSQKVTPSIVMIVNEEKLQNSLGDDAFRQFFQDDQFGNFFGFTPRQREQIQKTLGSGVVISSDGYIITNNHVVDNSTKLQVTLPDGGKVSAKIIGKDPKSDLALIKVDAQNLNPVRFGDYSAIQVGEWVLAIGSPFGEALQQTVTAGIISAKGRSNVGIADYENFLQTDAAINPGNSGGALVDLDGNLIGINTAIYSSNGSNAGVGFAIPINIVQNVVTQLKTSGHVTRGYLGVTIQDLSAGLQKSLKAGDRHGAIVSDVQKDSPAEEAGLKPYDIITSVNGQTVRDNSELRNMISSMKPGSKVELGVIRNGEEKAFTVKLTEMKDDQPSAGMREQEQSLGLEMQDLTPRIARELGTDQEHGAVITKVNPGSLAEDAGLQRGDVIFEVNRKEIASVSEFQAATRGEKDSLLLAVDRGGNTFLITLDLH